MMKKRVVYLHVFFVLLNANLLGEWVAIDVPHHHFYPANQTSAEDESSPYSMTIPIAPFSAGLHAPCDIHPKGHKHPTSKVFVSNQLTDIGGISFTGHVQKGITDSHDATVGNRFGVYFHEMICYDGGPEYGFIFYDNSMSARFYCSINSNIKDTSLPENEREKWKDWPSEKSCTAEKDPSARENCMYVKRLFADSSPYRTWSIKITDNGDFLIELIDFASWKSSIYLIPRPHWFPNLRKARGYITITAKRASKEIIRIPALLHIDELKIWKA